MSTSTETFQIPPEAAELYEAQFVPGIFAEWAPRIVDFAGIRAGQRVLDVACGTGIVSRTVADLGATVVGLDLNQAMLDVAARVRPDIEWRRGDAAAIPAPDDDFDVAVCQMALMFFPDRAKAIAEMRRVARDRVALLVPSALEDQPAYRLLADVVVKHSGADGASVFDTYWSCGNLEELTGLFGSAGLRDVTSKTVMGTASFESVDALVATEVEGSPLIERISDDVYARIKEDAREALDGFTTASGACEAPLECHLVRGEV